MPITPAAKNAKEREEEIMGKIIGEGITFDDVLLVPSYSEVIPNQVDLSMTLQLNLLYL